MTTFLRAGIAVDLPAGWDAQIRPAGMAATTTGPARTTDDASVGSVLHAASFPLPADRGDYGSGAVEVMGGSDTLICLLEHEPEAATTALFRREGVPALGAADFSPQSMQRAVAGMAGAQHFFQVAGRPFCLYVVIGSWRTRGPLVRTAASVVASLSLGAR